MTASHIPENLYSLTYYLLNANGELIGVEILKTSTFLKDFILESTQAKLMQLQQAEYVSKK
jgi:hypothetical protein